MKNKFCEFVTLIQTLNLIKVPLAVNIKNFNLM